MRNNGGELLVNFGRSGRIACRRQGSRVSVGEAQAVLVIVIRGLQPSLRLRGISEQAGDQARVIIAKSNHGSIMNAVERVERVMQVGLPRKAPGRQKGGRHIACAVRVAARQMGSCARKLSLFDIVNCDRKARQVVVRIARKQPFAERGRARFIAIGESGGEGALEKIGISRIGPEGFPVVDLRRKRVPVSAGDESRKIVARLAGPDLQGRRSSFGLDGCGRGRRRRPTKPKPRRGLRATSNLDIDSACLSISYDCQSANKRE